MHLPIKELNVGIYYPQISKKSIFQMNLHCMFHNEMDPYATVCWPHDSYTENPKSS